MTTRSRAIPGLAISLALALLPAWQTTATATEPALDEPIIADAYVYLIGRALVVRQEHLDVASQGGYNVAFHNPLGSASFVNPNLSVANTEAWIAVDDDTPVLLEIPKIEGRYYTAQILDEWGETLTNIHERNYPLQPYGKFAFVAPGSRVAIPDDAVRIELRSYKAKMLARVELQNDREGAVALQRQIRITPLGNPQFPPALAIPSFEMPALIGVELFAVQPVCDPGGRTRPQQLARHHGHRQLWGRFLDSQLGELDRHLGEQYPRGHIFRHDA